jgi:Bacterial Ig domain
LSTPILARIAADSEFRFRPDKSNERVFVFERGHGGPGFTGMPGLVGGFQNVNPEYSLPFGYLDSPRIGESVEGGVPLAVSGWAVAPSGIAAIVIQLDGRRVADATSTNRPDIERAFPKLRSTGYWASLSTSSLSAGRHEITVVAYARDGTLRILARVPVALRVPGFQGLKPEGSLPFGLLESPKIGDSVEGGPPLLVWGRAVAPSGITTVEIQRDGRRVGSLPARSLPAGPHEISVLAHARDGASRVLARIPINTFATQPK